jgi:CHASE3 domain sensor protein
VRGEEKVKGAKKYMIMFILILLINVITVIMLYFQNEQLTENQRELKELQVQLEDVNDGVKQLLEQQ